ncbi:hypothetical protein N8766_05930 [bacterium]|nr:hypothetical protein [bacterium]MDA7667556.1 hypothetical protein [bacterium]MDA7867326.1 hypothetical protein [Verrucomicrobiota bacterium]MDB4746543.1 hypothetical protein [Verrucomicrobiota bacterium]
MIVTGEVSGPLNAQPIELSLLESDHVLQDTLNRLRSAGCKEEALGAFHAFAIEARKDRLPITSEFRLSDAGYYEVTGLRGLARLAPPEFLTIFRTKSNVKAHSLTCFDVALLVLRDGPVKATHVRIGFEFKRFAFLAEGERLGYSRLQSRIANPSDYAGARHLLQPIVSYRRITGLGDRSQNEENLALCLRAPRILPGHYSNAEAPLNRLIEDRIELWKRDNLRFSERVQIVLAQYIDMNGRFVSADHIALALPMENGWMLIEKNGTMNPLIRINFPTLDLLADYMMSYFEEDAYDPFSPLHEAAFFVTLNEQILRVRPRQHRMSERGF